MRFTIGEKFLGKSNEIEISEEEYKEIKVAKNLLIYARNFEELYEVIILNYLELEKEILCLTLEDMVLRTDTYTFASSTILQINRRLINLLTSIKLYQDHAKHRNHACHRSSSIEKEQIEKFFSKEVNDDPNYTFMRQLRNHTQHYGLPVHKVKHDMKWTSSGEKKVLENHIQVLTDKSKLKLDESFARSALENLDEEIDIKKSVRRYVESISDIHVKIRELIGNEVKDSRNKIEEIHNRYSKEFGKIIGGVDAYKLDNGKILESIPLLLNWDDVRVELAEKNQKLINLSKQRIVSIAPD